MTQEISFNFLNQCLEVLGNKEFIELSENRFKNQIRSVVCEALENNIRLIRLAGPSGSGKTTSAKLIAKQIKANGTPCYYLSMDNWYKTIPIDEMPLNEHGEYDYESPELIDIDGFKSDVNNMLLGNEIALRNFDFKKRISSKTRKKIKCEENAIIIIEGLHAINPIFDVEKPSMKVYVEPSALRFSDGSIITSSNIRLCRRLHRDFVDRGMSFEDTIKKCASVDAGQKKYITPYTNDSRILRVDTLIFYEIFIHKNELPNIDFLKNIPESNIGVDIIPSSSVLKEFYK